MITLTNWLPQALVGTTFLALGTLKLYGIARGIQGGADKPTMQKLCGT
jgi:hypothetical protein